MARVPLVPEVIVVQGCLQQKESRIEVVEEASPVMMMKKKSSRTGSASSSAISLHDDMMDGVRVMDPMVEVRREEYGRRPKMGERIPVRSEAGHGEHDDMNMGCYYVMAALDFCWCL